MRIPLLFAALVLGSASLQADPLAGAPPVAALPAGEKPAAAQSFEGRLETGIVAIGGETTGTILKTKGQGTYELSLPTAELRAEADKLSGKNVRVEGDYQPRAGVEIKERRIIVVKSLKGAETP